jgi:FMN phosphatase YigB (HAD superfamily)
MMTTHDARRPTAVFLFDVDNTLLDNDRIIHDLRRYLVGEVGLAQADEYFEIFERLRAELGYADYLGALQRYRVIHARDPHLLALSSFLIDYPFANRLFPGSLDALDHAAGRGRTVILSDGDVVFQPRKVERSGLREAVEGRVLIYVHKEQELDDVEQRYPADHYVVIDDKPRILAAIKKVWGARVTTVFARQGHYAHAPDVTSFAAPDFSIERIHQFVDQDLEALIDCGKGVVLPRSS